MANLPNAKKLILDQRDGWLTIWFNSPENRNALSGELTGELRAVLDAVRDDRTLRGVTFRGKGGVFCAGGDLKGFKSGLQGPCSGHAEAVALSRAAGGMFAAIDTLPQVVVMLVEGAAMAGGLGIVCCGDVVAVTRGAKFALTETLLGIAPAQIAPYVAQRLGLTTSRRLMLTAARFDGEEAGRIGLADHVADHVAGLDAFEQDIRRQVMLCAPGANAMTKKILLATPRLERESMIEFAAEGFAQCMLSDEGREGVSAFVEKRKPIWARPAS
ncbi:MAG: enoyl-CoA hydratase/isomerase family protein [Bradyrhizobium sp.]